MELTKIEIENYKSIKSPIAISFSSNLPTILIGKNGSGKSNVLEALSAIAFSNSSNSTYWGSRESERPTYRAYIQLSEEDMAAMLPDVVYDKAKCEIVAYCSESDLKIDRIRSEYIVSSLRKEISDIRDLAADLKNAVDTYEKQLLKISHDGYEELPICGYALRDANGGLTNYNVIECQAKYWVENVREVTDSILQTFDDDEAALTFVADSCIHFGWNPQVEFRLEYVEPSLAKFEEKFITINKSAIKREITKINKATKSSCDRINELIQEIEDRTKRIQEGLDTDYMLRKEEDERYFSFLRHVQHIIGKRCLFLKNENHDVIFQKQDRYYDYNNRTDSILETYLTHVYQGSDKDELLNAPKSELKLSDEAVADFELFLNNNIPDFERDMYDSISVQADEKGNFSIFLNEKTGAKINLNETSAGRRWYFTYYFMKNTLSEGDIFIIDEPAAMLHPSTQREVLNDLLELMKRGVRVVYSTHSPYLIPKEWECVHFVAMTDNGTEVAGVSSNQELVSKMAQFVGEDIFDVQTVFDMYFHGDSQKIAKKCYDAVRSKNKDMEEIASELLISIDTIKSWNRKGEHFRCPKMENIIRVSKYANIKIQDLLN